MVLLRNDTANPILVVGRAKRACVRANIVDMGVSRAQEVSEYAKTLFTIAFLGIILNK